MAWYIDDFFRRRPWSDKTKERIAKNLHGEKRKSGLVYVFCAIVAFLIIAACLSSCRVQSFAQHHENDSVRVETRIDSVIIWKWDSIIQTERVRHDTILLTSEKWSIRWRDKIVEVHDTITTTKTETIVQPQPYVPKYNQNCTRGFWVLLAILILIIGGWFLRKYLKLKTGGILGR